MAVFLPHGQNRTSCFLINHMPFRIVTAGRYYSRRLPGRRNHPGGRRRPKSGITDNPDGIFPASHTTAGQQRIIRYYGSHTCHNGGVAVTQFLHMMPGRFSRNPFRFPGDGCNFSVHRHGIFHNYKGMLCPDVMKEHFI